MRAWGLQPGLGFAGAVGACRVFAMHAQGLQMGLGFADAFWGLQGVCRVCSWVWGLKLHLGSAGCLQGVLRAYTEFASGFGVCSCIGGLHGVCNLSSRFATGFGVFSSIFGVCRCLQGVPAPLGFAAALGACRAFARRALAARIAFGVCICSSCIAFATRSVHGPGFARGFAVCTPTHLRPARARRLCTACAGFARGFGSCTWAGRALQSAFARGGQFAAARGCCCVQRGCAALHGFARSCTALHGVARHCTALHGVARGCTELHGVARRCTAVRCGCKASPSICGAAEAPRRLLWALMDRGAICKRLRAAQQ